MNRHLPTKQAHLFWAIGIVLGAIARNFLVGFPYEMFGTFWTVGFLGVGAKNLIEKKDGFNNEKDI